MINNIEFVILLIIFIPRLLFFFPDFKRDLSSNAEGAGFLTIIAPHAFWGRSMAYWNFILKGLLFCGALLYLHGLY